MLSQSREQVSPSSPEALVLLARIQHEYREMPGLVVTCTEAQRLWRMDEPTCRRIMQTLIDAGFLRQTDVGFALSTPEGAAPPQFVPKRDRRQRADRRGTYRGGRRATDIRS